MANIHIHSGDKSESFDPQDHEQWSISIDDNGNLITEEIL